MGEVRGQIAKILIALCFRSIPQIRTESLKKSKINNPLTAALESLTRVQQIVPYGHSTYLFSLLLLDSATFIIVSIPNLYH